MADDLDDDIDLGEDFDFEDDIPEEDVDYDDSVSNQSPTGSSSSSSQGSSKGVVKNLVMGVFGVGFISVIAGGGYYAYGHFKDKNSGAVDSTIKVAKSEPKKTGFNDNISSLSSETDDLFAKYASKNTDSDKSTDSDPDKTALASTKSADANNISELHDDIQSISTNGADGIKVRELQDTLNTLAIELSTNINHVQGLERIVKDMSRVVISLNSTVKSMDNRVLSLTQTIDNISGDFGNMKSDITSVQHNLSKVNKFVQEEDLDLTKATGDSNKIVYKAPEFVVHAIIPGRAWLKSTSGKIITVTEGQSLGNYGSIAVIDTENGTVVTSSGTSFR